jgi:hypothetical protein
MRHRYRIMRSAGANPPRIEANMYQTLEHHEHAEHLAHGHGEHHDDKHEASHVSSNQMAALLVAVLAAGLAVTEQGAKHAEIRVQQNSIAAADAWAQYQAKSTRGTISKDLASVVSALSTGDATAMDRRDKLLAQLGQDQDRFENDPKDGKKAVQERARGFEEARDHALEQTHAYHNGAAAMELGIVLSTASAIIRARPLILMALAIGVAGVVFAILGLVAPELGAI